MAKSDDYILILYKWIEEMGDNIYKPDEIDDEIGMKRLWFFVRSVISIKEGGSQILSDDPFVDASVQNFLNQFNRIKNKNKEKGEDKKIDKKGGLTDQEWNDIIKEKIKEGLSSIDIFKFLKNEYNITYADDSIVRKSDAWKNRFK